MDETASQRDFRGSVKRAILGVTSALKKFSDLDFSGEVEFLLNLHQGGVTRMKIRSVSDVFGPEHKEKEHGRRNSDGP